MGKSIAQSAARLRFNVEDVDKALREVRARGVQADIETYEWGSTINLFVADGDSISATKLASPRNSLRSTDY